MTALFLIGEMFNWLYIKAIIGIITTLKSRENGFKQQVFIEMQAVCNTGYTVVLVNVCMLQTTCITNRPL